MKLNKYIYILILLFIADNNLFAQDSLKLIKAWTIDNYNNKHDASIDTSLAYFEVYKEDFRKSFSNIYLGNIGQASQTNLYFIRKNSPFLFGNAQMLNIISSADIKYYNTRRHFTNLSFYSNLSKKNNNQILDIIHTQNINEKLNFGILYKMVASNGEYPNQVSSNNCFAAFSSFDGDKYKYSANFLYNSIKNENNGGINDTLIENVDYIKNNRGVFPTQLTESNMVLTNREFNLIHSYDLKFDTKKDSLDTLPSIKKDNYFRISHSFNYKYNRLKYYNKGNNFYQEFLVDTVNTFDSTYINTIHNSLSLDYVIDDTNKVVIYSLLAGNEIETDYFYQTNYNYIYNYIGLRYDRTNSKNTNINFFAKYYYSVDKQNDIDLNAAYNKSFWQNKLRLQIKATHSQAATDCFEEHYYSNNMQWDTTFTNKKVKTDFDVSLSNNKWNLYFGVYYGIYDNLIYFTDTTAFDNKVKIQPFQETSTINYQAIYLGKDFNLKHWIINNKISYQKSSNNFVLSVPDFAVYNSTTFHFRIVKGVLRGGIGYNFYYYSSFNANDYNPSTNMFYSQNTKQIGNYPRFDAFVKFKLKRARIFLLFEHVTFGLFGTNYYAGINQPMNPRIFKFGVSWSFYD